MKHPMVTITLPDDAWRFAADLIDIAAQAVNIAAHESHIDESRSGLRAYVLASHLRRKVDEA